MALEFNLNSELIMNKLNTCLESACVDTLERMVSDIDPYVPYDTGELSSSVTIDESSMDLVYDTDYAEDVYYMNKGSNFKRDVHPLATSYWADEARQAYESKWIDDFRHSFRGYFGGD